MKTKFSEKLTFIGMIDWFDFPLASHSQDHGTGQNYVMVWCDEYSKVIEEMSLPFVQWMSIPVTPDQLTKLLNADYTQAMTLLELLETGVTFYLCEGQTYIYDSITVGEPMTLATMPKDLVPMPGSYMDLRASIAADKAKGAIQ
jgi:hypothetical protein